MNNKKKQEKTKEARRQRQLTTSPNESKGSTNVIAVLAQQKITVNSETVKEGS